MVENPLYNLLSLNEMELAGAASETLTSANLLSFAAQIASGMVIRTFISDTLIETASN